MASDPIDQPITRRIQRFLAEFFRSESVVVTLLLAAICLGSILFLTEAVSPWKKGLESLVEGKKPSLNNYVISGLWWGALINVFLSAILLGLRGWWSKSLLTSSVAQRQSGYKLRGWPFFAILLSAVAACAWHASPRLNLSLWGDEENTLRSSVRGEYKPTESGDLELKRHNWQRSMFNNVSPNNHLLNTILIRVSLDIWEKFDDGKSPLFFTEWVVRLPAFLGGLLGIFAIGMFLRQIGYPMAGLFAAWFCALHPWYIRYASEARGYGLVFGFLPLTLLFAARAWQKPTWGNWIGFGLSQFLLIYSNVGVAPFLALFNLALAICLWLRERKEYGWKSLLPPPSLGRWLVGASLGAMIFIQLYTPCYPQLQAYMKRERAQAGVIDGPWFQDLLGFLTLGTPWTFADKTNTLVVQIEKLLPAHPHLVFLVALIVVLALTGVVRLLRGPLIEKAVGIATLAVLPMMFLPVILAKTYLYIWYFVFMIPLLAIQVALGFTWIMGSLPKKGGRFATLCATTVFFGWFIHATAPQRVLLQNSPVEAQRESVLASRQSLGLGAADRDAVITVQIKRGGGHMMTTPSYDVAARYVENADELKDLMSQADARRVPLFVNLAMPELARQPGNYPDIMEMLDDTSLFVLARQLPGLLPNVTRFVYKYKTGALQQHDR